jgi:hypothetical protein
MSRKLFAQEMGIFGVSHDLFAGQAAGMPLGVGLSSPGMCLAAVLIASNNKQGVQDLVATKYFHRLNNNRACLRCNIDPGEGMELRPIRSSGLFAQDFGRCMAMVERRNGAL